MSHTYATITKEEKAALDKVMPLYKQNIRTWSNHCRNVGGDTYRALWVCKEVQKGIAEAKKRAAKNKWEFALDEDLVVSKLLKQGLKCAVTKVPFRRDDDWGWYRNPYRPSLDRIDSSLGYTNDNVRIVAYCTNAAMNEWGEEIIFEMAKHIAA